jgi:tol-pal system protein YbgF
VKSLGVLAATVALAGCALKSDVRRVETELVALRRATARADSARAVALERVLDEIAASQRLFADSLAAVQRRLASFEGRTQGDLTEVQRQLVQIQELTGQSQQRLSELRGQLESRTRQLTPAGGAAAGDTGGAGPGPSELYDLAVRQLRGGSSQTARIAFQKFLQDFPQEERVPDAWFHIGETWTGTNADSAAAAYQRVARDYADSPRAAAALYRLGLLAEQQGDTRAARGYYNRVVATYPRSEEAQLARAKLQPRDR